MPAPAAPEAPIGIVAGGGGVPIELADALLARGRTVHIVGIDGFVSAAGIARLPHTIVGLGQLGHLLGALERAGCREVVIVGSLERPDLRKLRIDWGAIRFLADVFSLTRGGDDSMLRRIIGFFERRGFVVRGIPDLAPGLLAAAGHIAGPPMPADLLGAVARARALLDALSRFDVGQGVVARPDGVIAVEAADGTRRMLGRLTVGGGKRMRGVLVKLPKIGQEMRIDLPTIGAQTIAEVAGAGLAGVAVASGATVIAERAELMARADAAGIGVLGLAHGSASAGRGFGDAPGPQRADWTDGDRALELAAIVSQHAAPGVRDVGVVVRHAHPLAVELDALSGGRWPQRLSELPRGWGLPQLRARAGTLALVVSSPFEAATQERILALLPAMRRAKLAALIVATAQASPSYDAGSGAIVEAARRAGLSCSLAPLPSDTGSPT